MVNISTHTPAARADTIVKVNATTELGLVFGFINLICFNHKLPQSQEFSGSFINIVIESLDRSWFSRYRPPVRYEDLCYTPLPHYNEQEAFLTFRDYSFITPIRDERSDLFDSGLSIFLPNCLSNCKPCVSVYTIPVQNPQL